MTDLELLQRLFRAFRDRNETAFRKVAESIIADQLAANHHGQAKELRAALGTESHSRPNTSQSKAVALSAIPRDRRSGEQLLTIYHEPANTQHLLLEDSTKRRIDRFINERRNLKKLASFGYTLAITATSRWSRNPQPTRFAVVVRIEDLGGTIPVYTEVETALDVLIEQSI